MAVQVVNDWPPFPTHCNYTQPNIGPLKRANAAAAPSEKKSAGCRTPVQFACLSQRFFFKSVQRLVCPRATIHQINTPSNLHNGPYFPHLPFQAAQIVQPASCQERSKPPLPKAQRNCPVIVHSSTVREGGGHRWTGGGAGVSWYKPSLQSQGIYRDFLPLPSPTHICSAIDSEF